MLSTLATEFQALTGTQIMKAIHATRSRPATSTASRPLRRRCAGSRGGVVEGTGRAPGPGRAPDGPRPPEGGRPPVADGRLAAGGTSLVGRFTRRRVSTV